MATSCSAQAALAPLQACHMHCALLCAELVRCPAVASCVACAFGAHAGPLLPAMLVPGIGQKAR